MSAVVLSIDDFSLQPPKVGVETALSQVVSEQTSLLSGRLKFPIQNLTGNCFSDGLFLIYPEIFLTQTQGLTFPSLM